MKITKFMNVFKDWGESYICENLVDTYEEAQHALTYFNTEEDDEWVDREFVATVEVKITKNKPDFKFLYEPFNLKKAKEGAPLISYGGDRVHIATFTGGRDKYKLLGYFFKFNINTDDESEIKLGEWNEKGKAPHNRYSTYQNDLYICPPAFIEKTRPRFRRKNGKYIFYTNIYTIGNDYYNDELYKFRIDALKASILLSTRYVETVKVEI